MNLKTIYYIINRYLSKEENREERKILYDWFDKYEANVSNNSISNDLLTKDVKQKLFASINTTNTFDHKLKHILIIVLAAASLAVVAFIAIKFKAQNAGSAMTQNSILASILPKNEGATIISSTGNRICLDQLEEGKDIYFDGAHIIKRSPKEIEYLENNNNNNNNNTTYHTLSTSSSSICNVILTDGTKISLQTNSRLDYPVTFGKKDRRVKLTGEGYFEVVKNSHKFIVRSGQQETEVLGTKFNVKNDNEGNTIKTALLEGSVRVIPLDAPEKVILLKPGQQSIVTKERVSLEETNTQTTASWTKGFFVFEGNDIKSVFDQIGKWYGIEIEYKGDINTIKYDGKIPNTLSLEKLIESLNYAEIPNTIEMTKEGKVILIIG